MKKSKITLIWDIENISVKYIDEIFSKLDVEPDVMYAISKNNVNLKNKNILLEYNIKLIQSSRIADEFIKDIFKITSENTNHYIIISNDSDFCEFSKVAVDKGKNITWILKENQKKAVLMKNNITYNNIKYIIINSDFTIKKKSKNYKSKINKNLNITKSSGKSIKLSLDKLEELSNIKSAFIETENKKIDIIKEKIIETVKHYYSRFFDGVCEACAEETSVKNTGLILCSYCERKFVYNYSCRDDLGHKEKCNLFLDDIKRELQSGSISYSVEEMSVNLLQKELNAIKLPKKYYDL